MVKRHQLRRLARRLAVILWAASPLLAQQKGPSLAAPNLAAEISSLNIPCIQASPKLEDFEGMEPATDLARKMLKIDKFNQKEPHDGAPA